MEQQLEWGFAPVRKPRALGPAAPDPPPAPRPRRWTRRSRETREPPVPPVPLAQGVAELRAWILEEGAGRIGAPQTEGDRVTVSLRARDDEVYHLRLTARRYVASPPSCTFVTEDGREASEAWPAYECEGPFRPPEFICTPPTAEFYEWHSERRYDPAEGTLVNAVCTIYAALQAATYTGRWSGGRRARGRGRDVPF